MSPPPTGPWTGLDTRPRGSFESNDGLKLENLGLKFDVLGRFSCVMTISSVAFLAAASSSCLLRSCLSFLSFSTWSLLFFGILRCGEKYYIVCDKLPIISSIVIFTSFN